MEFLAESLQDNDLEGGVQLPNDRLKVAVKNPSVRVLFEVPSDVSQLEPGQTLAPFAVSVVTDDPNQPPKLKVDTGDFGKCQYTADSITLSGTVWQLLNRTQESADSVLGESNGSEEVATASNTQHKTSDDEDASIWEEYLESPFFSLRFHFFASCQVTRDHIFLSVGSASLTEPKVAQLKHRVCLGQLLQDLDMLSVVDSNASKRKAVMHGQRRPTPESTYASQAARWKQGFKTPTQQGPAQHQTDLENALVSELCSSVGSSSFPPREVLQKLLRYLHTLDHDYICELLDDKFESPLWQVKAKALSVLSALLGSGEAEFYKQYYSGRLDLLEDLRNARKDMLRKRADKVYAMLRDYVPPDEESPLEMMRRMQEEEVEEADAPDMHKLMHTSPVVTSQQTPHDLMMDMNDSPRSSSAPLPAPAQEGSAFSFLDQHTPQPQQEYAPAQMAAEPMTPPVSNSAFGFLSANGGEADSPPQSAKQTPGASAFTFMTAANQQDADSPSGMPEPSAPPLSSDSSSFNFLNQSAAENSVHAIEHGIPSSSTTEMPSAFAFMGGQQQQTQQPKSASAVIPAQAGPTPLLQRRHTVFDTLPEPTMLQPTQLIEPEKKAMKEEEPKISDPIHDAFEGLDANDGAQALDSFDAYKPSSDAVHGGIASDVPPPVQSNEPLREVILEIEVPPGPMGVMLDRTIPDMTVIERFVPLPTGGRGYLELHPAICPGCALISINSIYVEDKGLAEVGPILGSLANAPKLLRFKKLMNQAWTANPSTLEIPYVPPPLEEEEGSTTDEKSVEEDQTQPESEDIHTPGSSTGEAFMTRLNGYSSGLTEIEAKLKEILRREHGGQPVVDRRNQLAQLHGTVEKIQTQGIDSVIFGEHRPPNYEEVKQFRSTLVRRADDLARLIQSTASANPPPLYSSVAAPDEEWSRSWHWMAS
ncbi:Hypothetical protein PHPALM_1751 [Phytophthora palmivora]|uniref:Uncharacterized protein n=1 Tax=Phytophthora palmivora TaxID=4796 RepID=A0A2P4YRK0_9STRA|nr:Hypothetical protein PHPALM_1751 [Phytophthora palmivora]